MTRVGVAEAFGNPPRTFYDGTTGRTLTPCSDCGELSDEAFAGDHGGDCIPLVTVALPGSALGVIRAAALARQVIALDDLTQAMASAGVHPVSVRPALLSARDRGWIEPHKPGGSVRSLVTGQRIRERSR